MNYDIYRNANGQPIIRDHRATRPVGTGGQGGPYWTSGGAPTSGNTVVVPSAGGTVVVPPLAHPATAAPGYPPPGYLPAAYPPGYLPPGYAPPGYPAPAYPWASASDCGAMGFLRNLNFSSLLDLAAQAI